MCKIDLEKETEHSLVGDAAKGKKTLRVKRAEEELGRFGQILRKAE